MTDFDKTTELRMKLDPLIEACRAELDSLKELSFAHGDELWNSSDDAAHYLGVSVDVLDRLARRGVLRRRVLPETRCIRYDVPDLDRLVDQS